MLFTNISSKTEPDHTKYLAVKFLGHVYSMDKTMRRALEHNLKDEDLEHGGSTSYYGISRVERCREGNIAG
jgi:hypothetical protein